MLELRRFRIVGAVWRAGKGRRRNPDHHIEQPASRAIRFAIDMEAIITWQLA